MRHDQAIGLAAALTLLVPSTAGAQSARGEMGSQARATVRITVSVVPRFRLKDPQMAVESAGSTPDGPAAMAIASNAGVRYQVVPDPAPGQGAKRSTPADPPGVPLRLLVVPD